MGSIIILASCMHYFSRVHENLVQHPSNNISIATKHFCQSSPQSFMITFSYNLVTFVEFCFVGSLSYVSKSFNN